jgi:hypothetical protein
MALLGMSTMGMHAPRSTRRLLAAGAAASLMAGPQSRVMETPVLPSQSAHRMSDAAVVCDGVAVHLGGLSIIAPRS